MTEETGLAVREETALAVGDIPDIPEEFATAGLEAVEQGDLIIPRARIVQPTSKLDSKPGEFYFNLTGESKAQIHAVLVNMTKGRVYWSSDLAADPICASDDAKTPRQPAGQGCGPTCDRCPYAQWGEDGEKPACSLVYNFLAADIEADNAPFILSLHGASVKHAKTILSAFSLKRKPLFSQPVVIASTKVTNDKGVFYEVTMRPCGMESRGGGRAFDWRPYAELYKGYKSLTIKADADREGFAAETQEPEDDLPDDLAEALEGTEALF